MGAPSYCRECSDALRWSTIREIVEGKHLCGCGHENQPNRDLADILEDYEERIEELEQKLESAARLAEVREEARREA